MFDPRLLVVLVATAILGVASEHPQVGLTFPRPAWSYHNIVDGNQVDDLQVGRRGLLNEFPCSAEHGPPPPDDRDRVLVPIAAGDNGRSSHLTFSLVDQHVASETIGAWEVVYWWGRYEDAPFENGDQHYTWGSGLSRQYRVAGEREWCSTRLVIPHQHRILGVHGYRPLRVDPAELNGTKATLAVRFSHYSLDDNIHDRQAVPRNVSTACVFVQFTAQDVPFGETCDRPDTIVNGPQLPADWQPPWLTSSRRPEDLGRRSGAVLVPRARGGGDGKLSTVGIFGIAVTGATLVMAAIIFYCHRSTRFIGFRRFFHYRERTQYPRLSSHVHLSRSQEGGGGGRPRPQAPRPAATPWRSSGPGSAGAHSPAEPTPPPQAEVQSHILREYREAAMAGGTNRANTAEEQLPHYGDLPPRYEEAEAAPR